MTKQTEAFRDYANTPKSD